MFSCVAGRSWRKAYVAIMLPGRQDADDWLNFMLSQKNLWPTLQPGVLSQRRSPNRSLVESGAGCRPSICAWISSYGGGCLRTECTPRLPLGSPKKNLMLCFLTGLPSATTRIRMKKNHIVVLQSKKSKHGGNNAKSGWHTSKAPLVFDFKSLLKGLSGKEAEAQSEVDAFVEHCAKRWQTREGTYQLKRRRQGAERGALCFTLSHLVLRISLAVVLLSCACWLVCLGWFVFCFVLLFSGFQGNFCLCFLSIAGFCTPLQCCQHPPPHWNRQCHDYVGAKDVLRSASGEALKQADHAVVRMTPLNGTTSQTASQLPSAPS